jgi:hypothetical protein
MESQETVKQPQEEGNGVSNKHQNDTNQEPALKRMKLDDTSKDASQKTPRPRVKGIAPIKEECYTAFPSTRCISVTNSRP